MKVGKIFEVTQVQCICEDEWQMCVVGKRVQPEDALGGEGVCGTLMT